MRNVCTIMKKKKIFDANPNHSKLKILANTEIVKEIYKINKKINTFVTCLNNGSHILGLKKGLKRKHNLYGIFSKSKFATSINSYTKYEYNKLINYFNFKKDLASCFKAIFNLTFFRKEMDFKWSENICKLSSGSDSCALIPSLAI